MSKGLEKTDKNPLAEIPSEGNVLVEMVKRSDIDPDRLEKFMELQFRYEANQAKQAFNKALAAFQGECPIIPKTKNVKFKSVDYTYAPIEEMVKVIKPILDKHSLSFTFDIKETQDKDKLLLVTRIRHSAGHSEEASNFFNRMHDDQRMNEAQRAKSAITFAKRVALENALGLVTEDDPDADDAFIPKEATKEQLTEIRTLISETNSVEKKVLDYVGADSIEEMNGSQAQKALHALKQKVKK